MNKAVKVVDVGPRDGFQSVKEFIPTEKKIEIIEGIIDAGVKKIQITSFVSPKAIPQMRDAAEVVAAVMDKHPGFEAFALVPNFRGAEGAVNAGLKEVSHVMSLSVTHNMNNVKKTHQQSIDEIKRIIDTYPDLKISEDIATTFGCPFEGDEPTDALIDLIGKIKEIGVKEFTLCDTVGLAYPTLIEEKFKAAKAAFPDLIFNAHIHDTRNMGILNTYIALQCGAASVQTALGGLGGCPFAPGASGNTSTEDLVYMLNKSGFETGIDFAKLLKVAKYAKTVINGNFSGHHINIEEHPCVVTQA